VNRRPLAAFEPFLVAANVRGTIDVASTHVEDARGQVGDLVIGTVFPNAGTPLTVIDSDRRAHEISEPRTVVAVLGPRDSSTHVCATIPAGGLMVNEGRALFWVAGESGIVGDLEREASPSSVHNPEHAVEFRCSGLVADSEGTLNVRRFAVQSSVSRVSIPVVFVAATSSEAGKTVLSGELIRRLSASGYRVGAIKVTGTGGVLDSVHHAASGAFATLDQVDAGLITTHCDANEFQQRIPLVFRRMEELGADLILAELGGDLVSANNPEIFRLPELTRRAELLIVIANDALAAAGVDAINTKRLRFPANRLRFLSSPFRNHAGMTRRMAAVGVHDVLDPRSPGDIDALASEIALGIEVGTPHESRARAKGAQKPR